MKRLSHLLFALLLLQYSLKAQNDWKVVPGKITTPWAEKVDPSNPLSDIQDPILCAKTGQT